MARRGRKKPNKFTGQGQCSTAQSENMYSRLDGGLEEDYGELNAHLSERFGSGVSRRPRSTVPDDNVPESSPQRVNNDIRKYYDDGKNPVAGAGTWLDVPEMPLSSEILRAENITEQHDTLIDMGEGPCPKKTYGPYDSNEDYLRTEYELLREDALRPLREAVAEVRKDPWKDEVQYENGVSIYDSVYITSLVFSTQGLATRVAFSLSRAKKHVRWAQSKRLITGTLVALSPVSDAFQETCILATVLARPLSALESSPPEVDLHFPYYHQQIDPMQQWIMVECRASFFEASRHTLVALQHMMREPFPLSEHLVNMKRDIEPPKYIGNNPYVDLSSLVSMEEASDFQNVNVLEEWPPNNTTSLDVSQSQALKRMLTSKVAVVQGPPGTGKTFVSVKSLQILCDNLRKDDAPIIVTAQTNHAVDQILRHTQSFEPNYIRLGGRSKDPNIKKRTLFEVRSALPPRKVPHSQKTQATIAMRKATVACQTLLAPFELGKGPLDHRLLNQLGLLTTTQAESLEIGEDSICGPSENANPGDLMAQWLGKSLVASLRPPKPDDFGFEDFEEEDLEIEQLQELEAEAAAKDDEEIEALKGPVLLLSDNFKGRSSGVLKEPEIERILNATTDLTKVETSDRGHIYNYFMRQTKRLFLVKLRELAKTYHETIHQRRVGLWEEDVNLLSQQRIIGMTTTGLSKYRAMISALRPRVVLVEEAAETMEAPVTVACLPTLEHLILVGDHQQLRPHTQVKSFEDAPFYLNLSLFERLVQNEVAYDTLTRQRRMIPEVRRLLGPIYGDKLKDHSSVKDPNNRPAVRGMGGINSYFFTHDNWPESRDSNSSCLNAFEAEFIAMFFDYLVLNGEPSDGITVLTFYNGQRKRILQELRKHPNLTALRVKVVTVDSYQGEENDIVILSLVRSNRYHSIGFLANDNRACVALSRAKRGFYLFGNGELMACESETWGKVVNIMFKTKVETGVERRVGYCFPVQCAQHGRRSWIENEEDWGKIHGGCDLKCEARLSCGHHCPYKCHPFEHEQIRCMMSCPLKLTCGHRCGEMCSDPCKCQTCDQRTGGQPSMLKPGSMPSTRVPTLTPTPLDHLREFSSQTSNRPSTSSGFTEQWHTYVKGGAQSDDAQILRKRREAEAAFLEFRRKGTPQPAVPAETIGKLIETSPERRVPSVSGNTTLLVDLDLNASHDFGITQKPRNSYASAARSEKDKQEGSTWSLLD